MVPFYEGIKLLLAQGARFDAIVVEKDVFRKWRTDPEDAFYQTYFQLARHVADNLDEPVSLRIVSALIAIQGEQR